MTAVREIADAGRPASGPPPVRWATRARLLTALGGLALLGALALALRAGQSRSDGAAAVAVGLLGAALSLVVLVPVTWRALRRHRGLTVLLGLVLAWLLVGLALTIVRLLGGSDVGVPSGGIAYAWSDAYLVERDIVGWSALQLPGIGLAPLLATVLLGVGGVVLIADAVRGALGTDDAPWGPWRLLTAPPPRRARVAGSAFGGLALVAVAALVAVSLLEHVAGGDPLLQTGVLLAVAVACIVVVASPVIVGLLTRADRDHAGQAREREQQRFAAHLHDSVLQTLALVQRQAHDPAAVVRLARRQEHSLRAWMAGESELVSETLAAAIREVVAEVEDEHAITIECTAIGDRPLDAAGEALAAAAREALRNAARHAAGAPVLVFCEIGAGGAAVFVRDGGEGFDPSAVAPERRGIRDAIVGRMAAAGGRGSVESALGQGTEVTLRIGDAARADGSGP